LLFELGDAVALRIRVRGRGGLRQQNNRRAQEKESQQAAQEL
jgi:hypothetical protein